MCNASMARSPAPVFKYGSKATATDLLHHVVYATATGLAYAYLDRSQSR